MAKTTMDDAWYIARHPIQEGDTYRTPATGGAVHVEKVGQDGLVRVAVMNGGGAQLGTEEVPIDRAVRMVQLLYWVKA